MKTLILLSLLAAISAQADLVRGYVRSNGTQVQSYQRSTANGTPIDNLGYRGYPSQQPGYVSPYGNGLGSDILRPVAPMPRPALTAPRPYSDSILTPSLDIFPKW